MSKQQQTDPIVESVVAKLRQRSEVGIAKYGTTLDENSGNLQYWLQNAQEEAMDFILYLERIKREITVSTPGVCEGACAITGGCAGDVRAVKIITPNSRIVHSRNYCSEAIRANSKVGFYIIEE